MAEKDREDLASVLEEALAEAEARAEAKARDRGTADATAEPGLPTLEQASRRSVGGLHQIDESGLPPIRRTEQPKSMRELLETEGGKSWAVGWVVLREALALIGLFWVALLIVSFSAPDGGLGLGVIGLTLLVTVLLRLLILGTSVLLRRLT